MTETGEDTSQAPGAVSIWQLKPWWCQPWSILLTGVLLIAGSWLWLRLWWLSVPLAVGVSLWWWLFLVLMPRQAAALVSGPDDIG
ncbi:hypothetical protein FQK07_09085 [Synechococcus sp. BSF8S]|uniref:DUF6737 family protein n=1 Tax=Synechococcales TaxID=1890424 RepID=UPI001623E4AF|nr:MULTISPECIES: DUF6737 family protein [unclassified Synechococcus]MBC1261420.1 hypothetical protein [Synechococcus sp. BSF8S]MBC1264450.1 hypothetical protein [Synechococcus sp. BSA11S]